MKRLVKYHPPIFSPGTMDENLEHLEGVDKNDPSNSASVNDPNTNTMYTTDTMERMPETGKIEAEKE